MKIWATHTYVNSFEMEVPDDATEEEIHEMITNEDEYLGGDWSSDWTIEDDDEEEE